MKNIYHLLLRTTILLISFTIADTISAQLLYRISGNGLHKPSYLFGTHHAVPLSVLDEVDNVFRCYNRSSAVVGEIALDEDSVALLVAKEAQMVSPIADFLSADEYLLVDTVLYNVAGMRLNQVAYLRPAMIENIFLLSLYESIFSRGADDAGMDSFFQQVALQQGKPVLALETASDQVNMLFHSQSITSQVKSLLRTIKNADSMPDDIRHLQRLYTAGHLDSIAQWSLNEEGMTPDDVELLITSRNKRWVTALQPMMASQSCFIAVGALHLPGPHGLISLLKQHGYKIKAVL